MGDPKLILADEPTGNLDTKNGDDVMHMLALLKEQGATILMVTHSPEHGAKADRIIEMLDGQVIKGSSADTVIVLNKKQTAPCRAKKHPQ